MLPVIVSYCDFTVDWDYERFKREVMGYDAGVPFFTGFQAASLGHTKYAYMKVENHRMQELREKESFTSDHLNEPASCGIYYFKSLAYLYELSADLLNSQIEMLNNEAYTSLLLNLCVKRNDSVFAYKINKFICFGTPEDYEQYLYWNNVFNSTSQVVDTEFAQFSLMPMAGEGIRFKEYGYKTSKPFIQIGKESLLEKCISSLPTAANYIYIFRKNDQLQNLIIKKIKDAMPNKPYNIISLDHKTEGQAITCLEAEGYYENEESLLISSCDYALQYDDEKLLSLINSECDVIIFTFKLCSLPVGSYEDFAYCKIDELNNVKEVVEKKCISDKPQFDQMVTGTFWFKKGSLFTTAARELLQNRQKINNEYYVGTSINNLINQSLKVKVFEVNQWISFGNPVELNLYYFWEEYFEKLI